MKKSNSEEHSILVNQILLRFSKGNIRLWKNHVGKARPLSNPKTILSYGLPGSTDLIGFCSGKPHAFFLAIECKTGTARLSGQQRNFACICKTLRVIHIVAKSTKDVEDRLKKLNIL